MREYELILVLNPQMDQTQVDSTVERIHRLVTDGGGEITNRNDWGVRRMAYPINHLRDGNYVVTQFQLDPSKANEVRDGLRLSEEVLRHLIVKIEK